MKQCLTDFVNAGKNSFRLLGDEVASFTDTNNDEIYGMSFVYERVTDRQQALELVSALTDPVWPTSDWIMTGFERPHQILLTVRTRGSRKAQGFISYTRRTCVESFNDDQLEFIYEIGLEYAFVTKKMRGKGLGNALIAPLMIDVERDIRYLAKRLNAERFRSMDILPYFRVDAEVHSLGAARLCEQFFDLMAEFGAEEFNMVPGNRYNAVGMFENEIDF